MSKKYFLVNIRGMTEDEADRELKAIAEEKKVTGGALDVLEMGGAE